MAKLKRSRFINTSQVLREIWLHRGISRVEIAGNLDLDKSTISSIVSELLAHGIVSETRRGDAGPRGGRKPVFLGLNCSYGRILGIEMRPEGWVAVAVDLEGRLIASWSGVQRITGANLRESFLEIAGALRAQLDRSAPLLGIGVGLSGVVNPQKALIRYSIPLRIESPWDFRREVADRYDLPIFIENDANACAWGELVFHRSKRLRDFVFVLSEFRRVEDPDRHHERIGVGLGIVLDGRVHHGRSFSAGEFRSVLCTPESRGQFSLSDEEANRVVDAPDILCRFIRELALNVAMLVNTFNLDHVFLGGDIERYREQVAPVLAEEIQRNWPYPDTVQCRIGFSSMGEKACAYGAAAVVLQRLFGDLNMPGRFVRVSPLAAAGLGQPRARDQGPEPPLSGEPPDRRETSEQARAAGKEPPGQA